MGVEVLRLCPQHSAFESYYSSGHAWTIGSVHEEYEKLERLTEGAVTWCILPTAAEPFTVFFNGGDMRLVILLGFTRGIEYHYVRVMRQFGFHQGAFAKCRLPEFF